MSIASIISQANPQNVQQYLISKELRRLDKYVERINRNLYDNLDEQQAGQLKNLFEQMIAQLQNNSNLGNLDRVKDYVQKVKAEIQAELERLDQPVADRLKEYILEDSVKLTHKRLLKLQWIIRSTWSVAEFRNVRFADNLLELNARVKKFQNDLKEAQGQERSQVMADAQTFIDEARSTIQSSQREISIHLACILMIKRKAMKASDPKIFEFACKSIISNIHIIIMTNIMTARQAKNSVIEKTFTGIQTKYFSLLNEIDAICAQEKVDKSKLEDLFTQFINVTIEMERACCVAIEFVQKFIAKGQKFPLSQVRHYN